MIFLGPAGIDGVWVMESSYTGTNRQTTTRDGTLIQNQTAQPGPYTQGDGGPPPTVVGSPQGSRFCAPAPLNKCGDLEQQHLRRTKRNFPIQRHWHCVHCFLPLNYVLEDLSLTGSGIKMVCLLLYPREGAVPSGQSESPSGGICYRSGYKITTEIKASNPVSEMVLKRCFNEVRLLNTRWHKTASLAVGAH